MVANEVSPQFEEIRRTTLDTCAKASGTVIVIDVLRAFTTAAFALDAGAEAITVVAEVEDAFALRGMHPDWLLMGEVDGLPIEGFDFGNSPAEVVGKDLTGRRMVQRTSSGTQGVVRSRKADRILTASLCCAQATAAYVVQSGAERVTMVITGSHAGRLGDEDLACADYLEALMRGEPPDRKGVVERVRRSSAAQKFRNPEASQFSALDLDYALALDRFSFAMTVRREGGWHVMRAVPMTQGGPPGEEMERN